MCVRFSGISWAEVEQIISSLENSSALRLAHPEALRPADAFPGAYAPAIMQNSTMRLTPKQLVWGFDFKGKRNALFNTRLETAAASPFWAESFKSRRCIVPALGFYEKHSTRMGVNPETGKSIKQLYRFEDPQNWVLLMAGIWNQDSFSIMTTKPHAKVAPIHDRSPLLLSPANALRWLSFQNAEPQHIDLVAQAQYAPAHTQSSLDL